MKISIRQTRTEKIKLQQLSIKPPVNPDIKKWEGGEFPFIAQGRKDLPVHPMNLPLDWSQDPFSDRNWCGQLQMWRPLDPFLAQFDRTKDGDWLKLPLKIACDWHDFYKKELKLSPLVWTDMHVGLRASKLAYLISQFQHGYLTVSDSDILKLEAMAADHIDFLCDYKHIAMSNHTFFDMVGLGALAQVVDEKTCQACYVVLDDVVPKLASTQFDRYGIHLENSPAYHQFGIDCLKMLDRTGWFPNSGVHALLVEAEKMLHWFILPDGRILPFGDSNNYVQNKKIVKTNKLAFNEVLNKSGYVILRNDRDGEVAKSSYFAVMGALNSKFHKQSDDLTFLWFDGEDIISDVGKYAYKSDIFRSYALSTRAHNTVEIDNENFYKGRISDDLLYGSAIRNIVCHPWGYSIEAVVYHKKFDAMHQRIFIYQPSKTLFVIDNLMSANKHEYTQWFHFASHLELQKNDGIYSAQTASGRLLTVNHFSSKPTQDLLVIGQEKPVVQGWISEEYAKMRPNYALGFNCNTDSVLLGVQIDLGASESSIVKILPDSLGINIVDRGYQYPLHLERAQTDGKLQFVEVDVDE